MGGVGRGLQTVGPLSHPSFLISPADGAAPAFAPDQRTEAASPRSLEDGWVSRHGFVPSRRQVNLAPKLEHADGPTPLRPCVGAQGTDAQLVRLELPLVARHVMEFVKGGLPMPARWHPTVSCRAVALFRQGTPLPAVGFACRTFRLGTPSLCPRPVPPNALAMPSRRTHVTVNVPIPTKGAW